LGKPRLEGIRRRREWLGEVVVMVTAARGARALCAVAVEEEKGEGEVEAVLEGGLGQEEKKMGWGEKEERKRKRDGPKEEGGGPGLVGGEKGPGGRGGFCFI
jgi:hypothetical protein